MLRLSLVNFQAQLLRHKLFLQKQTQKNNIFDFYVVYCHSEKKTKKHHKQNIRLYENDINNISLETYHFDSTYQYSTNAFSIAANKGDEPFNFTASLPNQISNIKKIYLKSVEIPVGFTNIRAENNSNSFGISVGGVVCNVTITPGQYTISGLITAINSYITSTSIYTTNQPIFSISGQQIIITTSLGGIIAFPTPTILSNIILGFQYSVQIVTTILAAASNYNLYYDTYLSIFFPYVNAKSTTASGNKMHFKIPYNGYNNSIFYSVESSNGFNQYIELTESNFTIGNLKVQVYDRYGYLINNQGLDWSFSLTFERDLTPTDNFINDNSLLPISYY